MPPGDTVAMAMAVARRGCSRSRGGGRGNRSGRGGGGRGRGIERGGKLGRRRGRLATVLLMRPPGFDSYPSWNDILDVDI